MRLESQDQHRPSLHYSSSCPSTLGSSPARHRLRRARRTVTQSLPACRSVNESPCFHSPGCFLALAGIQSVHEGCSSTGRGGCAPLTACMRADRTAVRMQASKQPGKKKNKPNCKIGASNLHCPAFPAWLPPLWRARPPDAGRCSRVGAVISCVRALQLPVTDGARYSLR